MSLHKYVVHLKPQQRDLLLHLTRSEIWPTHHKVCARVLLQTDCNQPGEPPTDEQVARSLNISSRTVLRIKARFLQGGLVWALRGAYPKEQLARRKLSEEQEALLTMLVYSQPPDGRQRWSLQALADQMVQLGVVESISKETVRQALKRMHVSLAETPLGRPQPHRSMCPALGENLLEVFCHLYDPLRPMSGTGSLSQLLTVAQPDSFSLPI